MTGFDQTPLTQDMDDMKQIVFGPSLYNIGLVMGHCKLSGYIEFVHADGDDTCKKEN